jgi:hypothetical protein
LAGAQVDLNKPILLTAPDAAGSSLPQAREVVQLAAQHGYNGISLGIGMARMTNPDNADLSGVRTVTRDAMQAGLKYVCWRLDVAVPNNQLWADEFNGGSIWPVGARPPQGAWEKIAAIWQSARDISAEEVTAAGKDPSKALIFVLGNEPGIGGVGGPSLGPWSYSGFYYNLFQATSDPTWFQMAFPADLTGAPEGYIEPGFWTMLRALTANVRFNAKTYCVSFEGAESSLAGQVSSVTGPDAAWLYANTDGYALNIFSTNARKLFDSVTGTVTRATLTPAQGALAFKARLDKLLAVVKSNPILANEKVVLTEFNASAGRIPDFADAFLYREEMLKQVMSHPGLDGSMIYSAYATDPTTASLQLFNRTLVNGSLTITPVGSYAVGPNNLGRLPSR